MGNRNFSFPKPSALIEYLIEISTDKNALILDSFAGSGTTAHAVLKANAKDGGNRKFILVEGEEYADKLTAERVRRAIKGYAWAGNQRETLLEEKITFTQFKKADEWLKKVEAIKAKEGFAEGDLADWGQRRKSALTKSMWISKTVCCGSKVKSAFQKWLTAWAANLRTARWASL